MDVVAISGPVSKVVTILELHLLFCLSIVSDFENIYLESLLMLAHIT